MTSSWTSSQMTEKIKMAAFFSIVGAILKSLSCILFKFVLKSLSCILFKFVLHDANIKFCDNFNNGDWLLSSALLLLIPELIEET